eukprot:CAMPEP_0183350226 /NCGR_PEP_ID=MMETSP0164_2-20130417/18256_1 /TAXON_ID=221442 /ORGANISM="Coccolithus pelagicus ssp braarudi, Strain PLY182g" /LENGTH=70 /DNA_ID=CAMNT_0025522113 /DNA_START=542 /DNA_END=754 /DNA_ORIENTATION=+
MQRVHKCLNHVGSDEDEKGKGDHTPKLELDAIKAYCCMPLRDGQPHINWCSCQIGQHKQSYVQGSDTCSK